MQNGETIRSIAELVDAVKFVSDRMPQCWWRGQASNWGLRPLAFREPIYRKYEGSLVRAFQLKARTRYANCPQQDDLPGWLFLMQHYRLPTRLLDWSASPLIALFFAVKDRPEETGRLFALSPMHLNQVRLGISYIISADDEEASRLFNGIFEAKPAIESFGAAAIGAREIDNRMLMQLAQFTIHDTDKPIQEFDYSQSFLFHFEVPPIAKSLVLPELFHLGIRESNLFPDLEHLANDLAETYKNGPPLFKE